MGLKIEGRVSKQSSKSPQRGYTCMLEKNAIALLAPDFVA